VIDALVNLTRKNFKTKLRNLGLAKYSQKPFSVCALYYDGGRQTQVSEKITVFDDGRHTVTRTLFLQVWNKHCRNFTSEKS
jgi:hypothetical protein